MNKNENQNDKFFELFKDLDDETVEEIVENYPALDEMMKRRIVSKCLEHNINDEPVDWNAQAYDTPVLKAIEPLPEVEDDEQEEVTVTGIEHDKRPIWYKYLATAVAFVVMLLGIGTVLYINRHMNRDNVVNNNNHVNEIQEIEVNKAEAVPATESTAEYSSLTEENVQNQEDSQNDNNNYEWFSSSSSTNTSAGYEAVVVVPQTTPKIETQPVYVQPVEETPVQEETTVQEESEPEPVIVQDVQTEPVTLPPVTEAETESQTEAVTESQTEPVTETEPETEQPTTEEVIVNENLPLGIWYSNGTYGNREYEFYFDFSGGHYVSEDSDMGLAFTWEISGNVITFHMAESSNIETAVISWIDDYNFILNWDNGASEYFTVNTPETTDVIKVVE